MKYKLGDIINRGDNTYGKVIKLGSGGLHTAHWAISNRSSVFYEGTATINLETNGWKKYQKQRINKLFFDFKAKLINIVLYLKRKIN